MKKPIKYSLFLVVAITLINLIIFLLFSLIWKNLPMYSLIQIIIFTLACLVSAITIAFLVIFTAPVLKDFLITYRRLLRLENLSHPLLMRLSAEAPGTYHHSIAVANLANKAAKAIGADSLLTRIGGYYHDIGKLKNPQNFIENQKNEENIHEKLDNPKESVQLIIEHVKNGLKLAEEYKLPQEVIAFIPEHQGTMLINYFYEKSKESGLKIKKSDFRYPGPKPLSRETAVLMLADAIEAIIRLLDNVTPEKIQEIVDNVIKERLNDNQLELSGLTMREINTMSNSFIETLLSMFHQRIEYPNGKKNEKFIFKNPFTK